MSISAAGAAGAAGTTASQGAVAPPSSAPSTQPDAPPVGVGKSGGGESSPSGDVSGSHGSGPSSCQGMSTQDFVSLNKQSVEQAPEMPAIDIKKLIEIMMALKLLEAMTGGETGSGGGFSGVA